MPSIKPKKKRITVYLDDQTAANLAAFNRLVYSEPYGANTYTVNAALQYYIQNSPYVEQGRMKFAPTDPTELVYDTDTSTTSVDLAIIDNDGKIYTTPLDLPSINANIYTTSDTGVWTSTDGQEQYPDDDITFIPDEGDELIFTSEYTIKDGVIYAKEAHIDTLYVKRIIGTDDEDDN